MTYEEIVRDTAEMTKRMNLKWDIITGLLILFCLILTVVAIRLMWEEHRERKERKRQEVFTGNEYRPTVTDTVQVIDGVEYHRMGVREGGDKYDNQPHV